MEILTPDCIIFLGGMNGFANDPRDIDIDEDERYRNFYSSTLGAIFAQSYFYSGLREVVCMLEDIKDDFVGPVFGYLLSTS